MSKVFINAGHSLLDPGAFYNPYRENELSIELKDKVVALFKEAGVEIGGVVPDNLYLKQSIAWVNERVDMNDIAFSIHFNAHKFRNISGTEDYYSNDREKHMAEIFSRTGFQVNRNTKQGSKTRYRVLGGFSGLVTATQMRLCTR